MAGVLHLEKHLIILLADSDRDRSTGRGVLDRVVDNIDKRLSQK